MTPLLCACAVVITLGTQNVEKRHLGRSMSFSPPSGRGRAYNRGEKRACSPGVRALVRISRVRIMNKTIKSDPRNIIIIDMFCKDCQIVQID